MFSLNLCKDSDQTWFCHSLTFARSLGRYWKPRASPSVFNTSLGTLRMLVNGKSCLIPILVSYGKISKNAIFLSDVEIFNQIINFSSSKVVTMPVSGLFRRYATFYDHLIWNPDVFMIYCELNEILPQTWRGLRHCTVNSMSPCYHTLKLNVKFRMTTISRLVSVHIPVHRC